MQATGFGNALSFQTAPYSKNVSAFTPVSFDLFHYLYSKYYMGEAVGYPPEAITFNSVLFLLTFLATGILLFFLIRILQKEQAQSLKLMSYQNLQEYIEKIEQLYRDTRRFQHGYINMLSSLYSYIEESAYPPLQAYFQDRILPTRDSFEQTDQQLGCLSYISLPELKGFLYTKLTYALHQKIQVTIDIHEPISEIHMDLLDLIQVTGIYLDNAIEAALQSDKKSLYLGITQADKKTLLVIKNACKEESADPERFYIYNFSTKGEHRGIGLAESKRIIDNYPNIMHSVQFENHYFYQQLEIFPEEEN